MSTTESEREPVDKEWSPSRQEMLDSIKHAKNVLAMFTRLPATKTARINALAGFLFQHERMAYLAGFAAAEARHRERQREEMIAKVNDGAIDVRGVACDQPAPPATDWEAKAAELLEQLADSRGVSGGAAKGLQFYQADVDAVAAALRAAAEGADAYDAGYDSALAAFERELEPLLEEWITRCGNTWGPVVELSERINRLRGGVAIPAAAEGGPVE